MKIVIATGIYPPQIGGPAQYAFNLEREFRALGHAVEVVKFSEVKRWPTGLRHLLYFGKIWAALRRADWCLVLDTFSVALPTVIAAQIMGRKIVLRTGGDFLWESYVERTGDLVLLRHFYVSQLSRLNLKETIIFKLMRWLLQRVDTLVFSTDWQRDIFLPAYGLNPAKIFIVENYFGEKAVVTERSIKEKTFFGPVRPLKLKNLVLLKQAMAAAKISQPDLHLMVEPLDCRVYEEKLRQAYAVVLVSISEVSPNLAIDALRFNKPLILTRETGLVERFSNAVLWVDPENWQDVRDKILWLAKADNYQASVDRATAFHHTHFWSEIATELSRLANQP